MLEKGDLITLSNDLEYFVINQTQYKGKNYLYLVTKDGISGVAICKLEEDNVTLVDEEKLFNKLLAIFVDMVEK